MPLKKDDYVTVTVEVLMGLLHHQNIDLFDYVDTLYG